MKMCYYLHFKVSLNTILNVFFRAITYKCDRNDVKLFILSKYFK